MRFFLILPLCLMLTGCSVLMPGKREFFQDKVKKFPELTQREKETQRLAAQWAAERARRTYEAAISNRAPVSVTKPAAEAAALTRSVSGSLGPPGSIWLYDADALARSLDRAVAHLNDRLDDFKDSNNENAGKKIEGTGLFSIGYFSMWGGIILLILLVWFGLKLYGMVNPVVGLGVNTAGRVASTVVSRGLSEVVKGGRKFEQWVSEHKAQDISKEEIIELFRAAQKEEQSHDVRKVVSELVR